MGAEQTCLAAATSSRSRNSKLMLSLSVERPIYITGYIVNVVSQTGRLKVTAMLQLRLRFIAFRSATYRVRRESEETITIRFHDAVLLNPGASYTTSVHVEAEDAVLLGDFPLKHSAVCHAKGAPDTVFTFSSVRSSFKGREVGNLSVIVFHGTIPHPRKWSILSSEESMSFVKRLRDKLRRLVYQEPSKSSTRLSTSASAL
ncbi:hypothetical protein AAVH_21418 [Aphelenchoides avenae]|nr:hypothetical protein AAVH_21418 [Aphelenchus avenae]